MSLKTDIEKFRRRHWTRCFVPRTREEAVGYAHQELTTLPAVLGYGEFALFRERKASKFRRRRCMPYHGIKGIFAQGYYRKYRERNRHILSAVVEAMVKILAQEGATIPQPAAGEPVELHR